MISRKYLFIYVR